MEEGMVIRGDIDSIHCVDYQAAETVVHKLSPIPSHHHLTPRIDPEARPPCDPLSSSPTLPKWKNMYISFRIEAQLRMKPCYIPTPLCTPWATSSYFQPSLPSTWPCRRRNMYHMSWPTCNPRIHACRRRRCSCSAPVPHKSSIEYAIMLYPHFSLSHHHFGLDPPVIFSHLPPHHHVFGSQSGPAELPFFQISIKSVSAGYVSWRRTPYPRCWFVWRAERYRIFEEDCQLGK